MLPDARRPPEVKNAHARKWMHSFAELAHANRAPLVHEVSLQVTPIRAVVLFSHVKSVVLHVASACSIPSSRDPVIRGSTFNAKLSTGSCAIGFACQNTATIDSRSPSSAFASRDRRVSAAKSGARGCPTRSTFACFAYATRRARRLSSAD